MPCWKIEHISVSDESGHLSSVIVTLIDASPGADPDAQKAVLRLELLPHGPVDLTCLSDCAGLTLRLPQSHLLPDEGIPHLAQWVSVEGGVWLRLDGHDVSELLSLYVKPSVHTAMTVLASCLCWTLFWEDDVTEESDLPF